MPNLWNIFRAGDRKQSLEALRLKIERFRELLAGNNRALDLLADAEEKLGGDFLFDMQYIRTLARELEDSVGKVIQNLNFITANRYGQLLDPYEKIKLSINDVLAARIAVPDAPFALLLEDTDYDARDAVGEKMARMGEVRKRLNMKIPEGFVITSRACMRLFDEIGLSKRLQKLSEDSSIENMSPRDIETELGGLVSNSGRVPRDVRKAIKRETKSLEKRLGKGLLFAVRSSAMGEDGELSFAGLHETILGVRPSGLLSAYLEVVASLFNSRAVAYRRSMGESPFTAMMAVGCQRMIPATASGVAYTLDPNDPESNVIVVSAAFGLGKLVVEGQAGVDRFTVSRRFPHLVVTREIAVKDQMYEINPEGGIRLSTSVPANSGTPAVSDEFLANLAGAAMRIERYMKHPQDIEWARDLNGNLVILQTRPLRISADATDLGGRLTAAVEKHDVLISHRGTVTCRGIGYGPVALVKGGETIEEIPENAVLVAHHSSPHLAELVPRAAAVITDVGAPTGHLATITREMRVPSIMGTEVATQVLRDGMDVTLDAEENIVYEGRVDELLLYQLLRKSSYEDAREFRLLRRMLKYVTPLNLKNPRAADFSPANCRTYHDIIRFAHEAAVESLAGGHDVGPGKSTPYCKKIEMDVPLDLVVINIGEGDLLGSGGRQCRIDEIGCEPLRRLLKGLSARGAWSNEPTQMDFESFMSSVTGRSFLETSSPPERNLAIMSEHYLNLNLHLGYHFNQIDAYVSDVRNDNYIYFRFSGGMTNLVRRSRRARMISIILEKHDFAADIQGDFIVARLKKFEREIMLERLEMIGRLIGFTRQMDVRMRSDAMMEKGVEEFIHSLDNDYNFPRRVEMVGKISVMVLDDEAIVGERLKDFLESKQIEVETFTDSKKAIDRMEERQFNVVVTDLKMSGPTGIDVLRAIREKQPGARGILITAYGKMEEFREAMVLDAFEIVNKPFQMADLYKLIKKAAKKTSG